MSSFVGHALAAATAFALGPAPADARRRGLWLGWLVVLAAAPDVDYVVRALARGPDRALRVTHSFALCLLLPALTVAALWAGRVRGRALAGRATQAAGAGLSHVALDLLVGVTALPLLWPVDERRFRLPFGVLPSAGRIDLGNPLLYRNTVIELGVLVPLAAALVLAFGPRYQERAAGAPPREPGRRGRRRGGLIAALLAVMATFAAWAATLPR